MPDIDTKRRNLHTSISPESLRLAQAQAALEGRIIGEVIDSAILRYCGRLAESVNYIIEKSTSAAGGGR